MDAYEKAVTLWHKKNITYHDTREIFEHDGVTSYTGDLRTLFEIRRSMRQIAKAIMRR